MSDVILDFECPTCGEAVTTNIVITRCGRCGGRPPASATKPRDRVNDALKLARTAIERGYRGDVLTLARHVIAQDEELAKLKQALAEALDGWADNVGDWAEPRRIAELRRLTNGE